MPAFGSWDWNDNLPFTQCFESATQAGFLSYTYSQTNQDQDLYVTPAMIVVPRTRVCHSSFSLYFFNFS